jgi:hypothetical protein
MPYLRQRQRIPATGKIGVRLTTDQRDFLLASPGLAREAAFALKRAPVKKGKLEVRMGRGSLDAMIAVAAAAIPDLPPGPAPRSLIEMRRSLNVFVGYLENLSDRFEDEEEQENLKPET